MTVSGSVSTMHTHLDIAGFCIKRKKNKTCSMRKERLEPHQPLVEIQNALCLSRVTYISSVLYDELDSIFLQQTRTSVRVDDSTETRFLQ